MNCVSVAEENQVSRKNYIVQDKNNKWYDNVPIAERFDKWMFVVFEIVYFSPGI